MTHTTDLQQLASTYPAHRTPNYPTVRDSALKIGLGVDYHNYGAPTAMHVPGLTRPLSGWSALSAEVARLARFGAQAGLTRWQIERPLPVANGAPRSQTVPVSRAARWNTPLGRVCAQVLAHLNLEPETPDPEELYGQAVWNLAWAAGYLGGGTRSYHDRSIQKSVPVCDRVHLVTSGEYTGLHIRHGPDARQPQAETLLHFPVHAARLPLNPPPAPQAHPAADADT